uniref:Uncharacterized protein n=1 Tax=Rhizophora mucronata TaxID=61149 RepID=A0A2P2NLI4_RHIMU
MKTEKKISKHVPLGSNNKCYQKRKESINFINLGCYVSCFQATKVHNEEIQQQKWELLVTRNHEIDCHCFSA